jgi:hypothetical protein
MNQLASYLEESDRQLISDAEEVAKLPLNTLDYREHRQIVNNICKQLTEREKNFKLLSQEQGNPSDLNIAYLMAYNSNIMTIKQLLYKFNLKK